MAKKTENWLENSFINGRRLKILALAIVLYTLVLGVISSADTSNVLTFEKTKDMKYGKATLTSSSLGTKIEDIELKDNTDYCLINCQAIKDINLYKPSALVDGVSFKILKGYGVTGYKFSIIDGYDKISVDNKETICQNLSYLNGTHYQDCSTKISGSHLENIPRWKDYKVGTVMPPGNYTLKLEGKKGIGDVVDWIIQAQGQKITNWALWNSTFEVNLLYYYDMDEGSGTKSTDRISGNNITTRGTVSWVTGKHNYGLNFPDNVNSFGNSSRETGIVGSASRTVNFWAKSTDYTAGTQDFLDFGDYIACGEFAPSITNSKWYFEGYGTCKLDSGVTANDGINMHTIVYNGTTLTWYINGSTKVINNPSAINTVNNYLFLGIDNGDSGTWYNPFNGWIDELGIWDRALSDSEIIDLWNSGAGLFSGTIAVSTDSPSDNSFIPYGPVSFLCSATISGGSLTNMSLWTNISGTWQRNMTNIVTGPSNATTFNINTSNTPASYKWNCEAGSVAGTILFAPANKTILTKIIENNQSYNPNVLIGSTQTFIINVSYDNQYYTGISAYLYYNVTPYYTVNTGSGNNGIFSKTISVPAITGSANNSFYWQISLTNATATTVYNSATNYQYVKNISVDNCGVYGNITLNYTVRNEMTQDILNASYYNTTIEVSVQIYTLDRNNIIVNYSNQYDNSSQARICLSQSMPSGTKYSLDSFVKYYSDEYVTRYHYIQNATLGEITLPQNINLYELSNSLATKFLITYNDLSYLAVEGAIITIAKQYLSEGIYKTIEIGKTDDLGQTIGWFDTNGKFSMIVSKNGQTLATFNNVLVYCTNIVYGVCAISLDASSSFIPAQNFYNYGGLSYYEVFNRTTRTYSLYYNVIDGTVSTIEVNLTKFDMRGNTSICYKTSTSSMGQIDCVISSSYGNITFIANIYKDGLKISQKFFTIYSYAEKPFGNNVIFFALAIMLTIPIMFIPSAIGVIIGTIVGFALASLLFFINGDYTTGITYTVILLVVAGLIIIWRMRSGGSD